MAALSDAERQELTDAIARELSNLRIVLGALTKADLRAAINAADAWADANAGSYNTALPQPARTVLTAKQKNYLLEYVLRKRRENS